MDNVLQSAGGHETLLEIHDLHVEYDTDDAVVHALNGFDLTLRRGEKLGLVGETGAGKSLTELSSESI